MNRSEAEADITTLEDFLRTVIRLLDEIRACSLVLYRARFREGIGEPIAEAMQHLESRIGLVRETRREDQFERLRSAGLEGHNLQLKLDSFQHSYQRLYETGEKEHLEDCLDKASTLLQSLAGAIPGFGTLAQELIEFLMKELSLKWTRRRR